jgi:hypothetical protein
VLTNLPDPTPPAHSLPEQARASVKRRRAERRSWRSNLKSLSSWLQQRGRDLFRYFTNEDPIFSAALMPALLVGSVIFVRSPMTNFIFDEQEALLANPYVNGKSLHWWQAFRRDFWGLPADHSIGSYRPLPNVIWRALWPLGQSPWVLHWVNILVHAVVAALLASLAFAITKRRRQAWLTGAAYLTFAVLTEAVTGVVGLADVLAALFMVMSLHALRTSLVWVVPGVFTTVLLGLFAKETAIVAVGLVPLAALLTSSTIDIPKPRTALRTLLSGLAAVAALVLYTELRRRWFPFETSADSVMTLGSHPSWLAKAYHAFLVWFHQPRLPADPMNNPLVSATFAYRVAGALRVYASGFVQLLVPLRLSGDYSFPSEPVPNRLVFFRSVLGGLLMIVPLLAGFGMWIAALVKERRAPHQLTLDGQASRSHRRLMALGLVWFPLAYFPLSNIPVILPTVRAERLWIIPALGVAFLVGGWFESCLAATRPGLKRAGTALVIGCLSFQALQARLHAADYADDLAFWQAAARAVPRSAKAHLNYAVMLGTRNRMDERLKEGAIAQRLAPKWPMAHVYQGDTLCRMKRYAEAFPEYVRGFKIGPNEPNLIALGLQCLWDGKQVKDHEAELMQLAADADDRSWLSYLVTDIVNNGDKYNGVQPKYRPRGYNEGPKK